MPESLARKFDSMVQSKSTSDCAYLILISFLLYTDFRRECNYPKHSNSRTLEHSKIDSKITT